MQSVLSYNSCWLSCKLKSDGDLILLLCFLHSISSYMLCIHAELHQSPYFIMHFKFFIWYVKFVYELQDIGADLHDSTLQMCIASKANSSLCTSSGGVLLYLAIKFLNMSIYTSYVHPRWKLNLYCHQSPKRERL